MEDILYPVAPASPPLHSSLSLLILRKVKTGLSFLFLVQQQAVNFQGLSTCLFWFKGTSAQGLLLQREVRRSGLKPAFPFAAFVMIWLLRVEWGENQAKSPWSPCVDNLGFQETWVVRVSRTLPEHLTQTAAQAEPRCDLPSKPCILLKERSCHSQPVPRAQPPLVLWPVSTCLLFSPLHCSPAQPQGPHLSQDWGM